MRPPFKRAWEAIDDESETVIINGEYTIKSATNATPMELLKQVAPEFAQHQMEERSLLFDHPHYQAVPKKYKLLAGIAVAAALRSDTCSQMWTKMARDGGVSTV